MIFDKIDEISSLISYSQPQHRPVRPAGNFRRAKPGPYTPHGIQSTTRQTGPVHTAQQPDPQPPPHRFLPGNSEAARSSADRFGLPPAWGRLFDSVGVHLLLDCRFIEEQIVERAERAVLFHLEHRHLVAVHRQFDEASPAIVLVRTDLADVFGIAIRTSHLALLPAIPIP